MPAWRCSVAQSIALRPSSSSRCYGGAGGQQQTRRTLVKFTATSVERSDAIDVGQVKYAAPTNEQIHHLRVTVDQRIVERRRPTLELQVNIHPGAVPE